MTIQLSSTVELPDDIATSAMALVGTRGSGKTYLANVMAEGMLDAHIPLTIIDPTGVWWGLRVGADGKTEGKEIAIIGGDHGDVDLHAGMGAALGELVATESLSCVIDVSRMKQREWRQLLLDFFTTLYQRNTRAMHLIIDEADSVAPQKARSGASQDLHDIIDDIVRRGRVKGIGCTMLTQRPAVISKNVLSQVELLAVLHLNAPQDHKAIEEWIRGHDTEKRKDQVLKSLSTLKAGEAWIWSPQLDLFERTKIRKRQTFDSSSTPKVGERRKTARSFADVDAEAFRELLESPVLEEPASTKRAKSAAASEPQTDGRIRALQTKVEQLEGQIAASVPRTKIQPLLRDLESLKASVDTLLTRLESLLANGAPAPKTKTQPAPTKKTTKPRQPKTRPTASNGHEPSAGQPVELGESVTADVTKAQRRVLDALRWWEAFGIDEPTREQVAFLCGYAPKGSTMRSAFGGLRTLDYIDYTGDNRVYLTEVGYTVVPQRAPHKDEEALHAALRAQLNLAQRKVLDVLLPLRGEALSRQDLAEETGYEVGGSTMRSALGRLRTLGAIDYQGRQGPVYATEILFPE